MTIPTGLETEAISRDPEVVRAYKRNPLVHEVARSLLSWSLKTVP